MLFISADPFGLSKLKTAILSERASSSNDSPGAQSSPVWLSDVQPMPGSVKEYPSDPSKIPTGPLPNEPNSQALQGYPPLFQTPPTDSPEVQAVINAIDWSKVPEIPTRKSLPNRYIDTQGYSTDDPDCWWSVSHCNKPKYSGLPEDIFYCPKAGDWGLSYDDGPFTMGEFAEPDLYDFLAEHQQKAALFYIGSNVFIAPAAAQRALAGGHTLCSHTWSHPAMTGLSNEEVVAEFYWSMRVIKESAGVTIKCWRPPYGDVDDRVRAIAWQMGMRTVHFDRVTYDWELPASGDGGAITSFVDSYFDEWIRSRNDGTDDQHGHIVLQHEHSDATVEMAKKWLLKVQGVFRVVSFTECMNIPDPYWEENFIYPTDE
ncbi:glycoside hydrolase/deacetylase [Lichtheimia hyalospora FSU 10163]|nr:glycoside hydrolase/deacetylase [Lichtheimia hyalospora FSU 10163]